MSRSEIEVVAGVIEDSEGRILIAQRPEGTHLAGGWEFPGGKVAAGETASEALARELREELGIDVVRALPLVRYRHTYPERTVVLDVWRVAEYSGEPRALEGQPLRWESLDRLLQTGLLEADRPVVEALLAAQAAMLARSGQS